MYTLYYIDLFFWFPVHLVLCWFISGFDFLHICIVLIYFSDFLYILYYVYLFFWFLFALYYIDLFLDFLWILNYVYLFSIFGIFRIIFVFAYFGLNLRVFWLFSRIVHLYNKLFRINKESIYLSIYKKNQWECILHLIWDV